MLYSSTSQTRSQQSFKKPKRTADTTWAFWVKECLYYHFVFNMLNKKVF